MFNRVRSFTQIDSEFYLQETEFDASLLPVELRELYDNWSQSGEAESLSSAAVAESDWPVAIYVPERYEEHYAYPLVIWFHSNDTDEDQLEDFMNAMSSQNYIGLSLRANSYCGSTGGYRWATNGLQFGDVALRDLLHMTTCRLRRAFHIHSERIFVAGSGGGADAAMQVLIQRPSWFAGGIFLDSAGQPDLLQSERLTDLRGKPMLQTLSRDISNEQLARHVEAVRLLRAAGANVQVELKDRAIDPCSGEVRFIDHWIMSQLSKPAFAT